MTREDIIRMAREAGLHLYINDLTEEPYARIVERFAALVAAAEREACAKVCDVTKARIWEFHPYAVREAAHSVCANLAAAIRAREQA
jgi:hypothetical protein